MGKKKKELGFDSDGAKKVMRKRDYMTDMEKGWIVKVTGYNISKEDMLRISESVEIR